MGFSEEQIADILETVEQALRAATGSLHIDLAVYTDGCWDMIPDELKEHE